jgi:ribosomal protein L35
LLKRVKITGRGKVKWRRAGASHLNSTKSGKKGRELGQPRLAKDADIGRIRKMLHCKLTGSNSR